MPFWATPTPWGRSWPWPAPWAGEGARVSQIHLRRSRERLPRRPRASQPEVPDLSALLGQVDPRLMQMGLSLLKNCKERDDRNAALLRALRPFLKEERRAGLGPGPSDRGGDADHPGALDTHGRKGGGGPCITAISRRRRTTSPWPRRPKAHPPPPPRAERAGGQSAPGSSVLSALGLGNLGGLFSGAEGLVSRLLPDNVDAGDILLLLIVLYLLAEGDDLDLVIALGLTLVLGLGSGKEKRENSTQAAQWPPRRCLEITLHCAGTCRLAGRRRRRRHRPW